MLRLAPVPARLCRRHPLPTAPQPPAPGVTELSRRLFSNAAPTHVRCLLSCLSCCAAAPLVTRHRVGPAFLLASEVCLLACGQLELLSDAPGAGAFSEMKNYTSEQQFWFCAARGEKGKGSPGGAGLQQAAETTEQRPPVAAPKGRMGAAQHLRLLSESVTVVDVPSYRLHLSWRPGAGRTPPCSDGRAGTDVARACPGLG